MKYITNQRIIIMYSAYASHILCTHDIYDMLNFRSHVNNCHGYGCCVCSATDVAAAAATSVVAAKVSRMHHIN